ncbi:MAG: trigger factor [Candidatus Nomurabacteria bacterium]|nr:trigger factor [Candidatus Nomurabacteria bacterium]
MKIKLTKLPKSEIQLDVVVPEKDFEAYREKGFKAIQQVVEIDGFRKGNAPEDMIIKKYGEMTILEEMANIALRDAYVEAIKEHKFNPVADPKVTITKLAKGNPLELTMIVPIIPEVELPSYKNIAKEVVVEEKIEVTDKDIDDVVEELRKGRSHQHAHEHEGHDHADHEGHDHSQDEVTIPELNDEFAQSFGDDFKTLNDLRTKIGENMKLEKEQKSREKRRAAIMEKLIAETKTELPDAIIENELSNMLSQMKADVTRYGGTWEDYLTHSKKTEEEMKASWRTDAGKRAMSQLVLHKIAEAEKLIATEEEVEVELVRLMTQMQDVDEERAKSYLYQSLTNEKVLKFLEESK